MHTTSTSPPLLVACHSHTIATKSFQDSPPSRPSCSCFPYPSLPTLCWSPRRLCKMKTENLLKYSAPLYNSKSTRAHSQTPFGAHCVAINSNPGSNLTSLLTSDNLRHLTQQQQQQQRGSGYSDRESICSVSSAAGRIKRRSRYDLMRQRYMIIIPKLKGKV